MASTIKANEIHITRVYDAPVAAVWAAWTDLEQVAKWWGPRGFTITTHSKDLRVGGHWRYTMHGPDGVDYPNVTLYHVVEPLQTLEYDHGGSDDRPPLFRVRATFAESDGQTTMHLVFRLATPEAAVAIAGHIRKAGGNATWDRLAEHLLEEHANRPAFVIHRTFEATPDVVFAMFVTPEHLVRWLPPTGTTMRFIRPTIAVGETALFCIEGTFGAMFVEAEYLVIEPPRRLVYVQSFVDEFGNPAAAPGSDVWPPRLRNTVHVVAESAERTRVSVVTEPLDGASPMTPAELAAFVAERGGMTGGWTSSFDVLEAVLVDEQGGRTVPDGR
jgi:uncharacterized protein YndB with AHSA1/START domain